MSSHKTPAANSTNPSGIGIKIKQAETVDSAGGETSRVTTDGNLVQSSDPSTNPNASVAQKLKGDLSGAVQGTIGGIQAAAGATLRNKEMAEKGQEKMAEEDQRLGAKRGVMPVGSGQRETTTDA